MKRYFETMDKRLHLYHKPTITWSAPRQPRAAGAPPLAAVLVGADVGRLADEAVREWRHDDAGVDERRGRGRPARIYEGALSFITGICCT